MIIVVYDNSRFLLEFVVLVNDECDTDAFRERSGPEVFVPRGPKGRRAHFRRL